MKKYKIVINGTEYEVEIEEIDASEAAHSSPSVSPAEDKSSQQDGGNAVKAPIPGTVLRISRGEGVSVKAGDVLLVLESMKMENEIVSPSNGVVSYKVSKGAAVAAGDVLCVIK
ncbi:MAG: biotin/lipoyl-binding protein [Clostridia bacterium]|nr:biotin/lipoyl-binding protein [Clostridia bacterium]MBR5767861.1 biotin/lipoyl-binding protein [Clostridia bacterium]